MSEMYPRFARFNLLHGPPLRPREIAILATVVGVVLLAGLFVATGGKAP